MLTPTPTQSFTKYLLTFSLLAYRLVGVGRERPRHARTQRRVGGQDTHDLVVSRGRVTANAGGACTHRVAA